MAISRRDFLGSATTGAIAGTALLAGGLTCVARNVNAAFAAGNGTDKDILVVLFLRFGVDGLSLIPPADDSDYHDNRPTIGLSSRAALPIGALDGVPFFMHPKLAELMTLYDGGKLAVVHAVGLRTESRSHFVSQDMMERAVADGEKTVSGGWLGRHLAAGGHALPGLSAITSGAEVDTALQGYLGAMAVASKLSRFTILGDADRFKVIEAMNIGTDPAAVAARATLETIRTVQSKVTALPSVPGNPAGYTSGALSESLRSVATLIKAQVGLQAVTVDFGGWDHHKYLNQAFPAQAEELSRSLAAFWNDLGDYHDRLTVVTMTEFGRRVEENANGGLDHGSASTMLVLGGHVHGRQLYGRWPGLKAADLHAGDLAVTTDYRQVLQEILIKRRSETTPATVFPTLSYEPLGIVGGDERALTAKKI